MRLIGQILHKESYMLYKKIIINFVNLFILCCLTSWNIPAAVSRQQKLPDNYEEQLNKLKERQEEKKESKKQEKQELRDRYKSSYLAHQKNRLAYFADHDGFIWFDDEENKYTFFLSNFYPKNVKIWDMKFSWRRSCFSCGKILAQT